VGTGFRKKIMLQETIEALSSADKSVYIGCRRNIGGENSMGSRAIGVVMVALAFVIAPAGAQTAKRSTDPAASRAQAYPPAKPKRPRAVATRPATRVVVTKRSYLDAGTEVKPGERHFTDYVFPPGYNVWSGTNIDPMNSYMSPPDPFWLPGTRCWPNC
jgi:hypothetical protein